MQHHDGGDQKFEIKELEARKKILEDLEDKFTKSINALLKTSSLKDVQVYSVSIGKSGSGNYDFSITLTTPKEEKQNQETTPTKLNEWLSKIVDRTLPSRKVGYVHPHARKDKTKSFSSHNLARSESLEFIRKMVLSVEEKAKKVIDESPESSPPSEARRFSR